MSEGNWYDPYLAPGIVVGVVIAAFSWIRSYLSGKKSNVKEAKDLEDKTHEKALEKRRQEISDAKILEDEAEQEAILVKKESREHMDNKFRFSDQEHAHQHAELVNKIRNLDTKIEQISKDLRAHIKSQNENNQ